MIRAHIDRAAAKARTPTDGQKDAGNYRKGKIRLHGLDISIENPRGSMRSGTDKAGKRWSVKLPDHYGYIRRTEGSDGDHVDCYIGRHPLSSRVFVVDQVDADSGEHDEFKCMLGYTSKDQALSAYRRAFSDGRAGERLGSVREMDIAQFKRWLHKTGNLPKYAEGGSVGDDFNTAVPDEAAFQAWKAINAPRDSGADYDLRGAYLANLQRDANDHMNDRFKKPNHPTFSDQSQYAVGNQQDRAGFWLGHEGPDQTFVPPAATRAGGGHVGYAEGGTPDKPAFDPSKPFEPVQAGGEKPPFDPNQPFHAATETPAAPSVSAGSQTWDAIKQGAKGLARGAEGFVGDMGEAVMGPFGPSHHAANLMATLGLGERPKTEPTYGQQLAHATGMEANPTSTAGKYAGSIGEVAGNPASWVGPGGPLIKGAAAVATGAGGEGARQAAEGTPFEGAAGFAGSLLGGYGVGKASAVTQNVMRSRGIQTTQELHDAADRAYTGARALGVEYQPQAVQHLEDSIRQDLLRQGHRADLSGATFHRVEELTNPPTPANPGGNRNFSDIEGVRQSLNMVRQEVHPTTGRPTADARAAGEAIDHIDNFLANPANAIPAHHGLAQQAAELAEEGRGNWAAMSRSQQIEQQLAKGERNAAATGSGANIDNALRQQVKNILNSPSRARNFTADDRAIMQDIVMGNPVRNSARLIGKMAATGIVSAAGAEYLAHVMGLGAIGHAAIPAAGYVAKKAGDVMTRNRINRLLESIRMDSPAGRANPVPDRTSTVPFTTRSLVTSPFGAAMPNPYQP